MTGTALNLQETRSRPSLTGWVGLAARLVLGGALLYAGGSKVAFPQASARAVQAYQILPFEVAAYVGYVLPAAELLMGALLVVGLFTRPVAALGALLMLAFIAGIASAWARGLSIDCGCFGGGGQVGQDQTSYPQEIARDLLFAACGGWLVLRGPGRLAVDHVLAGRTGR